MKYFQQFQYLIPIVLAKQCLPMSFQSVDILVN